MVHCGKISRQFDITEVDTDTVVNRTYLTSVSLYVAYNDRGLQFYCIPSSIGINKLVACYLIFIFHNELRFDIWSLCEVSNLHTWQMNIEIMIHAHCTHL